MPFPFRRALVLLAAVGCLSTAVRAETLRFPERNGEYGDFAPNMQPAVRGPLVIRLSSSSERLLLADHALVLEPIEGDLHAFGLTAEIEGEGDLEARIEIAGSSSRLADHVTLPRQNVYVSGTARIWPDGDGWLMTLVERPDAVELDGESELAEDLGGWCERTMILSLLGIACDGLSGLLSTVSIPMPKPGEEFRLERSQLTEDERAVVDAYFQGVPAASSGAG